MTYEKNVKAFEDALFGMIGRIRDGVDHEEILREWDRERGNYWFYGSEKETLKSLWRSGMLTLMHSEEYRKHCFKSFPYFPPKLGEVGGVVLVSGRGELVGVVDHPETIIWKSEVPESILRGNITLLK